MVIKRSVLVVFIHSSSVLSKTVKKTKLKNIPRLAKMTALHKVLLVLVLLQVALTLAKPYEELFDSIDGTFEAMRREVNQKRGKDCGSGREHEGSYSRKCRSSCRSKERHISIYDNKCSSGQKCCMCHVGWRSGCSYDG